MSKFRLIAFAATMLIGAAHLANAASPNAAQADRSAQSQMYAQANRSELSLRLAQDPAATFNAWAVTGSGAHIQSRAGFVGYH
jgi:hypothetical protein